MKDYTIFTDGDVELPSPYDREITILPQYYYFEEDKIYGDEQILSREEFFEQLRSRRAYTSGVNPDYVRRKFEETLQAGQNILCITVSSGLSGSYSTICMVADELRSQYPECSIEVIDSLNATLASGFLCVDAIEMKLCIVCIAFRKRGKREHYSQKEPNMCIASSTYKKADAGGRA